MAVFGILKLHEDDALRAVTAAVELRDRVAAMNEGSCGPTAGPWLSAPASSPVSPWRASAVAASCTSPTRR
jgi:hypothetical protein